MRSPLLHCLCAAMLLAALPCVLGWGHEGHLFVCAIAQGLLSDAASRRVQALLPDWAAGYMPQVCSWPDFIGHASPAWHWSLHLHYIDTPDRACTYNPSRDCRKECVAAAIRNYTGQLNLPSGVPVAQGISSGRGRVRGAPLAHMGLQGLEQRMREQAPQLSRLTQDAIAIEGGAPVAEALRVLFGPREKERGGEEGREEDSSAREAAATMLDWLVKGKEAEIGDNPQSDYDPSVLNPTVALMFVLHFVGDIHQPLHVGFTSDYGGNRIKVQWYKWKTNLHEVWDTEIIKHGLWKYHKNNYTDFVLSLAQRLSGEWAASIPSWVSCSSGPVCPNTFASESIQDACKWAYNGVTTGDTLGDAYFESRFPVVEVELAKAAVRLAATLNRVFSDDVHTSAA